MKKAENKKNTKNRKKVLIVAGGTGGHIFPAMAFGEWLIARGKARHVAYLSGNRPLEAEIYASRGITPIRLPLEGSPLGGVSLSRALGRCMDLARAFFGTRSILARERPDICFLFGGYVSLMPLLWCRFLGIPVLMHEQNARAGRVTRLASRLGVSVAAGWTECRGLTGSFTTVGIPVRPLEKMGREEAARLLDLNLNINLEIKDGDTVIGLVGGSLGSASLNALARRLSEFASEKCGGGRQVFIVAGEAPEGSEMPSVRFIGRQWDMKPFYSLVDGVVCRAGASTLAELAEYGIPALAVPWERASDGHQEANARCFAAATLNPLWRESGENEDTLENAFARFLDLCGRKDRTGKKRFDAEDAPLALWRMADDGVGSSADDSMEDTVSYV